MLPHDNEEAAHAQSGMFSGPRVVQFWDPKKLAGIAFSGEVFPRWAKDAASSLPPGHFLVNALRSRADAPPEQRPLWDIAFFYKKGTEWQDSPPTPAHWMKQIAYLGKQEDGTTGLFWQNTFAMEPTASDWFNEITTGMKDVIETP